MKTKEKVEMPRTLGGWVMGEFCFAQNPDRALEEARDGKATGVELFKNGRFKAMLEKDQKVKRLPAERRAQLLKGEL